LGQRSKYVNAIARSSSRQLAKVRHEFRLDPNGLRGPAFLRARLVSIEEGVPDVPHLREQGEVGIQCFGAATDVFAFGEIRGLIDAARCHLQ
jgi:hypothetical protein